MVAPKRVELLTFRVWTERSNQLSYSAMVERKGVEPSTSCVQGRRSSQVSYPPKNKWWRRQDLNLRPLGPKPSALPSWATSRDMHPAGFEPATAWFVVRYSIQLSQGCLIWNSAEDRNRTGTKVTLRRILSPVRLPVPPPRPLKANDGVRTRDPHLGKVMFYHWTTFA